MPPGPDRPLKASFFVLRTPLLPFDELRRWGEGLEAPAALDSGRGLEQAIAVDGGRLRERLREVFDRPEPRAALFLGSPDLEAALDVWRHEPESERGRGLESALVRYFVRMTTRPTPFGLFAGCSVGPVGPRTRLALAGRDLYRRHTRLDTGYLVSLTSALLADRDVRAEAPCAVNSSLYRAAGTIRWVETRTEGGRRSRHLVAAPFGRHLDATLERARSGVPPATLVAGLVADGVVWGEAAAYVDQLLDSQVLVPGIDVALTGSEPLGPLVEQLRDVPGTQPAAERLAGVAADLAALDAAGPGVPPEAYRQIARSLARLPAPVELGRLVQVDLVKPSPRAVLGTQVVDELRRGVEVLHRLAPPFPAGLIEQFCADFERRYHDREVPLAEALDPDLGVGFGAARPNAPLLEGLNLPGAGGGEQATGWGGREDLLLAKLLDAAAAGSQELVLDGDDVERIAGSAGAEPPPLPSAFFVSATLAARGPDAFDSGRFDVVLYGVMGPPGASAFGRFCHADPELRRFVEGHLRDEQATDPDAAWAEIVHLPEGRFANVVLRPVLRAHEIAYLGRSGTAVDRQITIEDLTVAVRGGGVVLRSRSLGARVVPRLTTAHDWSWRSLPLYRFLGSLQHHGVAGMLAWRWGPLGSAAFLPRVRLGRLVLSTARWRVSGDELRGLARRSGADLLAAVREWRAARRVPRLANLLEGDRQLLVDFDNVASVESFARLVRSRASATFEEFFPGAEELAVHGPEGAFAHQLMVPFVRQAAGGGAPAVPAPMRVGPPPARVRRRFSPGSGWLSAKVYAGEAALDRVLLEVVAPLATRAMAAGAADHWYFLRYGDPDWHLRARFHGDPAALREAVLPMLEDSVASSTGRPAAWQLVLDTYEREVARYGGPAGVVVAEQVFAADSEAAVAILQGLPAGDEAADLRWRVALLSADALLDDLGLNGEEKLATLLASRRLMARLAGADGGVEAQLSRRFRAERRRLEALVEASNAEATRIEPGLQAGVGVLRARSRQLAPLVAQLRSLDRSGELSGPVAGLASSYVHMSLNRLLRCAHWPQELVIYDFLGRLQRSRLARVRPRS